MPRATATPPDPNLQALSLKKKSGGAFGGPPPPVRKPTRGNLGGAVPRGGRTRLPPEMAAGQRGAAPRQAPKKTARKKAS